MPGMFEKTNQTQ